jgi:hypothetical protein
MNTHIVVIPHSTQRYNTVGDYWMRSGSQMEVRISDFLPVTVNTGDKPYREDESLSAVSLANKYEFLVQMHEMIEAFLCREAGISFADIDDFDMAFTGNGEPGDDENCPYRTQHKIATEIEKQLADAIGVNWDEYGKAVDQLSGVTEQETKSI